MIFLDTNIAIDIRDAAVTPAQVLSELSTLPVMSVVTWIELEGGVHRNPAAAVHRRESLDDLLSEMPAIFLTADDIREYGRIVASLGFNRARTLDRLIAAQCLTRSASLITRNPRDFREIEGLKLINW